MSDLIDWYRRQEDEGEHPIVIAATFHYRFIRIHPFDDGNGRIGAAFDEYDFDQVRVHSGCSPR